MFFQSISINLGAFLHFLAQQAILGFYRTSTAPALESAIECGSFCWGEWYWETKIWLWGMHLRMPQRPGSRSSRARKY